MSRNSTNSQIADHWKARMHPAAMPANIVTGEQCRFTVLTPHLVRCEYSAEGRFEDRASQVAWHRDFPEVEYDVRREGDWLIIETSGLVLQCRDNHRFSARSLRIDVKASGIWWHFGRRDRANLRGTRRTLDMIHGRAPLKKGLLSRNGWSWLDDSSSLVFEDGWPAPRESVNRRSIDGYFFGHGRDYSAALRDWFRLSGATPLIPRAILGNWWSRYFEYTEDTLKDLVNRFEAEGIPLSVCIIDMDWHQVDIPKKYGSGWTGYTWNRELFPDPGGMLSWLHDRGLLTSLNLHPARGFRAYEEAYDRAAGAIGIDPASGEPVRFDAADPRFWTTYFEEVHHPMEEEGVDFWWVDWQQGRKSGMKGLDPLWMLNHLHFLDSGRPRLGLSRIQEARPRPFTFSRYSGPGAHRYPIGFSGDSFVSWASLKFQPEFTARASNIGYGWWSNDIGGHHFGGSDSELYARWVQQGVFSPIMRLHSTKAGLHRREPWRHEPSAAAAAADFMRLRHRLIPYIYTAAMGDHREGAALVRPLYHLSPEEQEAYRHPTVYWFGSELISAPVVEKARRPLEQARRRFFLPAGRWYSFADGTAWDGGRVRTRYYRIDEHPLFAKAGAVVPLADYDQLNATGNPERLSVEIFPGADNRYLMYEDDGTTTAYTDGAFSESEFELKWTDTSMNLDVRMAAEAEWLPMQREMTFRLRNIRPEATITAQVDRQTVEAVVSVSESFSAHGGPALEVLLKNVKPGASIRISARCDEGLERTDREDSARSHERAFDILDRARGLAHMKYRWWKRLDGKSGSAARRRHLARQLHIPRRLRRALIEQYDD